MNLGFRFYNLIGHKGLNVSLGPSQSGKWKVRVYKIRDPKCYNISVRMNQRKTMAPRQAPILTLKENVFRAEQRRKKNTFSKKPWSQGLSLNWTTHSVQRPPSYGHTHRLRPQGSGRDKWRCSLEKHSFPPVLSGLSQMNFQDKWAAPSNEYLSTQEIKQEEKKQGGKVLKRW